MVAIARHLETGEMILSDPYPSAKAIKNQYPGNYSCYFCKGDLSPVNCSFRDQIFDDGEVKSVYFRTHFKHKDGNSSCAGSVGQSLEHLYAAVFWQHKLENASKEHFRSEVTPVYETLLKGIDKTRRPDLGLAYKGNIIACCEVQLSKIAYNQVIERSNDHLSLGMNGSWWAMNTGHELDSYLREYGIAYTFQFERSTDAVVVDHPVFGADYRTMQESVKDVHLTFWLPGEKTDASVPEDYYAEFIESAIKRDNSFPCHNKYIDLLSVGDAETIVGNGKRNLIRLSDYLAEQPDPVGTELRDENSRVLGILVAIQNKNWVIVLTPDGDKLMSARILYVDKKFIHSKTGLSVEQIIEKKTIQQTRTELKEQLTQSSLGNEMDELPKLQGIFPVGVPKLKMPPQLLSKQMVKEEILHSVRTEQTSVVLQTKSAIKEEATPIKLPSRPEAIRIGLSVASTDPQCASFNWRGKVVKMHPLNPDLCYVSYPERVRELKLKEPIITAFRSKLRIL